VIELTAGELEASVEGGELLTVTSLRHRGEELLVGAQAMPPGYSVHRRRAGITLLHPWANRLSGDSFEACGVAARVPSGDPAVTRDEGGQPIHGLARPDAWTVGADEESGVARASAEHPEHPAFPFPHQVSVRMALDSGGLTVTTELRPTGGRPVPIVFGWHPYFRLPGAPRAAWQLQLPARRHLALDGRGIPKPGGRRESEESAELGERTFDDGYDEVADGAVMAVGGGGRVVRVVLEEGYPAAQLFAPPEADVVSLEPMTAVTDALRSGRGLRVIAPGETARAVFSVQVRTI
jgi:galactose mutarotase-like enzyme